VEGGKKVEEQSDEKDMGMSYVSQLQLSCHFQLAHLPPRCSKDPIWKNNEKHASSLFTLAMARNKT
jgi:hypothetical protein